MIRSSILACILVTMWIARPVVACTCSDLGSIADEYRQSSAVFVGRIISIEVSSTIIKGERVENMIATFFVERRWKGSSVRRLRVQTCGTQTFVCTCGADFQLGQRYVVFAGGKPLQTSSCNRNTILAQLPKGEAAKIRATGAEVSGYDLLRELDVIANRK
ncbi:MAG TPA: hypothetical protein VLB68_19270 [Pyrinomonadaceae bacterium]|nr:hypothetical protein [Pyrinomonadaceae bacterium]